MDLIHESVNQLGKTLVQHGFLLTTAESCTGGWIAEAITSVAGSSSWFERGFITYSNLSKKEMLGVLVTTLEVHGAVSEEVAREMATGALAHSVAHASLAVTGIAGPSGGTFEKPVGTVCFAWAIKDSKGKADIRIESITERFPGDRQNVRQQAVLTGLRGMMEMIEGK
uniref:Nicotinamide-nucleotide amidase n=1 Tax=Candidatus Kentrum sp. FW TaxID=2126338 RepID=A0A450SWR2_9GAMM|nr:MAG: nicotinamide-nucleotide amidase [Candidatus Kentron sp. FW]